MSPLFRLLLRMTVIVGTIYCVNQMDSSFPAGKSSATDRHEALRPDFKVPFAPIIWIYVKKAYGRKTKTPESSTNAVPLHDTIVTMSGINLEDQMNGHRDKLQNQMLPEKRKSGKRLLENNQVQDDQDLDVQDVKLGCEREIINQEILDQRARAIPFDYLNGMNNNESNMNDGDSGGLIDISYLRSPSSRQKQFALNKSPLNKNTVSSVSQRFSEKQPRSRGFSQKKSTSRRFPEQMSGRKFLQKLSTSREFPQEMSISREFSQKQSNGQKFSHEKLNRRLERTKRSVSFPSRLTSYSSCKGKCGGTQTLPCRCDFQCLVYGNCCEDMGQECPKIMKLAQDKWKDTNLLNAETTCDSKSSVFMVTSCYASSKSNVIPASNGGFLQNLDNTTPYSDKFKKIIMDLMKEAPVTDATTGIVFRNRSVFDCYAGPDSIAVAWDVHIPYVTRALSPPSSIDEINQMLDNSKILYVVDSSLSRDLRGAPCKSESIGTCNPQLVNVTAIAHEKCPQLISYVGSPNGVIYNNVYCLWCNLDEAENVLYTDKVSTDVKHFLRFNILLHVTDKELNAKIVSADATNSYPWKTFQCTLLAGKSPCHVVKCLPEYTLTDGVCTVKHFAEISFVVHQTSMSARKLKKLSSITECVLKDYFGNHYLSTGHLSRREISNVPETETYAMRVEFYATHVLPLYTIAPSIEKALYIFSNWGRDRHHSHTSSSPTENLDVNNIKKKQPASGINEPGDKKEKETNAEKKENDTTIRRNTFSFCVCFGLLASNLDRPGCPRDQECADFERRHFFNESAIYSPPKHCVDAFMSGSGSADISVPCKKSCLYQLIICLFLLQILVHINYE